MGLCSCLAGCLAWGVQHWILLAIGGSWVLPLRWRSLGELSLIDTMWGREVSGRPMSWSPLFHLRGSGLTPGWSTKTLSATWQKMRDHVEENWRVSANIQYPLPHIWVKTTWTLQPQWSLQDNCRLNDPRIRTSQIYNHTTQQFHS